ncbi:MAG: S8 family serine peptidase [Saprospiraceae bacterium]|nr:S8 family serine peptidase [Saprospiraceae bacterium]
MTGLSEGLTEDGLKEDVFRLGSSEDVCVDIFVKNYGAVVSLLANDYSISSYQPGSDELVITTFFPIAALKELNLRSDIIQFVRATPVGRTNANSTLPNQGDFAQESFFARAGFDLSGAGVKIGVLSDSYNKSAVFGNQSAQIDVDGGVLPGNPAVGSANASAVQVLQELPGDGSDEGRGMLQIVHSVAPEATLLFHTAFISPNSFADGIRALSDADCDVVVDDVTYITESFFGRGVVAQAVNEVVTGSGVEYLTSAGNFADRSYESTFSTTAGNKHDFQGGDFLQELTLEPGDYLMVLQWDDQLYSIGESGAQVDLDIYLADANGNKIYGFNRNNLGADPVEVMPFSVISSTATKTNLLIENGGTSSAEGMPIKYVVFKAGGSGQNGFSAEYFQGGSTVVGHANHPAAMTVGAVRYTDTPTYGGTLKTESFSSVGQGAKPDFTGPNGGNVTINLGNDFSEDVDNLPNFLGTSAAAPHVAGICALLIEAQDKFGVSFDLRSKLQSTAIDYGEQASKMGAGFVSAFSTLESFANPAPDISKLDLSALGPNPSEGGVIVIEGSFFNDQTQVFLRDMELEVLAGSTDSTLIVEIPPFLGNPPIWIYNAPLANGDGGADTTYTNDPVITDVQISSISKMKKYGEALPPLSFTTDNEMLNGDPALMQLLRDAVTLSTTASDTSSVGDYAIIATWDEMTLDPALQELFAFTTGAAGFLTIEPVELTISPLPITAVYGEALPDIEFAYQFDENVTMVNEAAIRSTLEADHHSSIAPDLAVLVNLSLANLSLANLSLANRAFLASLRSTIPNLSLANLSLANGMEIIEVDARLLVDDPSSNLVNGTNVIGNLSLVNFLSLANNTAYENSATTGDPELNLSLANLSLANLSLANYAEIENIGNLSLANLSLANFLSLANLSLVNLSLANGTSVEDFSLPLRNFLSLANSDNTGLVTILTPADISAASDERVPLVPVNFVTGLEAGPQKIVPAAFLSKRLSKNFIVSYEEGDLTILPAEVTIDVADQTIGYGDGLPNFEASIEQLVLDDSIAELVNGFQVVDASGNAYDGNAGTYQIRPILLDNSNYQVSNINNGQLTVGKAVLDIIAVNDARIFGSDNPEFELSFSGFIEGDQMTDLDELPVVSSPADCNSDVGSYPIELNGGNDNNYAFQFGNGELTIDPSPMTIRAVDLVVSENEAPVFLFETSTVICEQLVLDAIDDPLLISGELDRPIEGGGSYTITPTIVHFSAPNHVLELVSGELYVNPTVGCNNKIRASDLCQEDIEEVIDGILYTSRLSFEYTNSLDLAIHVPFGSDNNFKTKGNAVFLGNPPTVFEPGRHTFEVLTNGGSVQWQIKTPGCNNADKSVSGSNADPCNGSTAALGSWPTNANHHYSDMEVFPSPFVDEVTVRVAAQNSESRVRLLDATGRLIQDYGDVDLQDGYRLDLGMLAPGIYFIQARENEEALVKKIIKL